VHTRIIAHRTVLTTGNNPPRPHTSPLATALAVRIAIGVVGPDGPALGADRRGHGQDAPYRFALWNLLDSLGWSVAVAASAYGIGRLATGHHAAHDVAILIIGLAAGAIVAVVAVRRHRRRRTQRLEPIADGPSEDPSWPDRPKPSGTAA
jgi:hypothetical protein